MRRNNRELNQAVNNSPDAAQIRATFEHIRLLMGEKTERAFEAGKLLLEIQANGSHEFFGLPHFTALLREMGLRASTAYSNMAVARHFDVHAHGHLGIGKLRLLAANEHPDRFDLLAEGVPVEEPDGTLHILDVQTAKYSELSRALKAHRDVSKRADAAAPDARMQAAVAAFIAGEPAA